MRKEIKIAVNNLLRLNRLRIKRMLNKNTWQEFFLYKRIVKHNANKDELSEDVKSIIDV